MPRDPKYDILFEPVKIGPKTMRNRFYQSPHCTGFGESFPGAQAHFRGMKAEGGWAVVNTEATTILPSDDFSGFGIQSRLWDGRDVANWRLMCERAHEHGALAGIELHVGGSVQTGLDSRVPTPAVSAIVNDALYTSAVYELDKDDIRSIQQAYVRNARLAFDAGFDIINVHGAEVASLPIQFLMRKHNKRTDEYGGSFENRARFWLETLELVREAVGDQCAIAARYCVDSLHGDVDWGIRVEEEGVRFIQLADHLVDFWDLQVGGQDIGQWVKDAGNSRFHPENWQGHWVAKVRPYTGKPIVGVGRFTNPDTMVEAIRSGQVDIIGAARPSIADPFLPRKIEQGRLDEIRECIGCNMCVARVNAGSHIVCTQNATAGEEYRRGWHPERFDKAADTALDVLVVGAGPAGMECAIALGKRGMRRVHLVEADSEVGGHMRWVPRLPGLGDWGRVVAWRKIQLAKLKNVELVTDVRLSAADVRSYGADIVITATGSSWATNGLNAATHDIIVGVDATRPDQATPDQIMQHGKQIAGERVLVYDTEGYFMGPSIAEKLARDGHRVTYVTTMLQPGMWMDYTGEWIEMRPLLYQLGIEVLPMHIVTRVEEGAVHGNFRLTPDRPLRWEVDAVVVVTQRVVTDSLYRELKADPEALDREGIRALYRVGDCLAPRLHLADAIFDGHRLAREIDTEDPAVALPYIRENRFLGMTDSQYDGTLRESAVWRPSSVLP